MTQDRQQSGATREVAERVKELRRKRGVTAADLAERVSALGVPWDRSIVANLESGRRRSLTIDELLAVALALNVAPVHLLVPVDGPDERYQVTAKVTAARASVRAWVRGVLSIDPEADPREYYTEVPRGEYYYPAHLSGDGEVMVGPVQGRYPQQQEDDPHGTD